MPSQRSPLVLAIDLGTSSVRTALFGLDARRLRGTLAQQSHAVSHADDGAAELDPAALERGLLTCLHATLAHASRRPVLAVGVSCFWHGLLGTDTRGKPLTPVYTWADSRCRGEAARLREETPETEYHAKTGCMLRASFWPAKLRWLTRTRGGLARRVARWQSPADWLRGRFCEDGAATTAPGMATGTGLFNPRTLGWEVPWLERCAVRREQLAAVGESATRVHHVFARRFPTLANVPWWPAVGDGAAGNLGSGATRPGRAAINVGTSAAFRVMHEGPDAASPFGLFCYRVDARRYVVGGAVSNAGNLRAWCRRELRLAASDAALDSALAARPEPMKNLVVLPFWTAERAPTWCEDLGGVVQGLSQNTTALDLLQATTEAVFHRLALIADLSEGENGSRRASVEIVVSGGILKSTDLLQRLADVLGRPVRPSLEPEASLRGAAVYALEKSAVASETSSDLGRLVGPAVRPRSRIAALYARERERQGWLEAAIRSESTAPKLS